MKAILFNLAAWSLVFTATARSQTINWGSEVFSDLRDSNGLTIPLDGGFIFELGAFNSTFIPTVDNVGLWRTDWNVFDRAAYSEEFGYFTGTTQMTDDGLSESPWLSAPTTSSFEGLDAYMWIRKGLMTVPGTEWLVVHANDWMFPTAVPGCCDNLIPVEFSVSDLTVEMPEWGRQELYQGPGEYTVTSGVYTLQTYTFLIPEPSGSAALVALISAGLLIRRRR